MFKTMAIEREREKFMFVILFRITEIIHAIEIIDIANGVDSISSLNGFNNMNIRQRKKLVISFYFLVVLIIGTIYEIKNIYIINVVDNFSASKDFYEMNVQWTMFVIYCIIPCKFNRTRIIV